MLSGFPKVPDCKLYKAQGTAEQYALIEYWETKNLSQNSQEILKECIAYYKILFPFLKSIDLSNLNENEVASLWKYVSENFNTSFLITNEISFNIFYRATIVHHDFLIAGKIRDDKYLFNPPLLLNQQRGVFNRCNSPNRTMLYGATLENVAILETKPEPGQRVIITVWENSSHQPFNAIPIHHTSVQKNDSSVRANFASNKFKIKQHPLYVELFELCMEFLSTEFVKNVPIKSRKKYEYLYSAFFAEQLLTNNKVRNQEFNIDMLVYPSIAFNHTEDNLCIAPDSLDKIRPIYSTEWEVYNTFYSLVKSKKDTCFYGKKLRTSTFIGNGLIKWDDD